MRRSARGMALLALACAAPGCARGVKASEADRSATSPDDYRYEVTPSVDGRELSVLARYPKDARGPLVLDEEMQPYVDGPTSACDVDAAPDMSPTCDRAYLTVRYRVHLGEAAAQLDDPDFAASYGGAIVAPSSSWLLHPSHAHPTSIAVHRAGDGALLLGAQVDRDTYAFAPPTFDDGAYAALGAFRARAITVGRQPTTIAIAPAARLLDDDAIASLVARSTEPLLAYFGTLRARRPLIIVVPRPGPEIDGVTLGGGAASVLLRLGVTTNAARARDTWVVTHELVHANLPSVEPGHAWFGEGIATYVEPIARARVGRIPVDDVWRDLIRNGPSGLPSGGEGGLDATRTWGRTYWGGALFCLAADIEIRTKTNGAKSLDDALRAIAELGFGVATQVTLARAIEAGDAATGLPVLAEQYERLGLQGGTIDLEAQWRALGVRLEGERVIYDDGAPLAGVRRAVTGARQLGGGE